ncbi:MAG TPA: transposase [Candidatus Binatia bacterium]
MDADQLDFTGMFHRNVLMVCSRTHHRRRSIRLPGYDYARPGAYFVTVCTGDRVCLFGTVVDGEIRLNETGQMVRAEWMRSVEIRREISLDEFVVMPNHLHGIIFIHAGQGTGATDVVAASVGATGRSPVQAAVRRWTTRSGPPRRSLGSFVAGFKSAATMRINALRGLPGMPVWQRNYYEHVIRDESELQRIREYIRQNPLQWAIDRENPEAAARDVLEPWEPQAR